MTGLYCRARANIHITVIRCVFNCCFHSFCCLFSLELHPGELNYILALQRHTGQTAVLQALTLGHMRSNNYSTTKIFVDNFLLSIMSTNRCSPIWQQLFDQTAGQCCHFKSCPDSIYCFTFSFSAVCFHLRPKLLCLWGYLQKWAFWPLWRTSLTVLRNNSSDSTHIHLNELFFAAVCASAA